jgi:hypothetical protein
MVLEFPAPHIAVFKPSPSLARKRKFAVMAAVVAAVAAGLVMMIVQRPGHKLRLEPLIFVLVIPMAIFGSFGLTTAVRSRSGTPRCITFDRRQGVVWKEARKLEPIWQGGIRLRDVASLELNTTPLRGVTCFALDMVMSRPQGQRARLIVHVNRDVMKADAGELARFLNLPLTDRTA